MAERRNVEPDVLGQHVAQAGHDLFGFPALALEVDDVGLHEDRAAITETREAFGAECGVGVLFHRTHNYANAEEYFLRSLAIQEKALGAESPALSGLSRRA